MHIQLQEVSKKFGRIQAMDEVSLEFAPGQIIAVLGANGAGKTTLLRCLAGIVGPDRGRVLLDGEDFQRDRLDLRRRCHFVPEFPFLFWDYSALRNASIIVELYEARRDGLEQRLTELLKKFDLVPVADRPVHQLSRGQIYKVGLAIMLAIDPEVWILDEPMASGMDPRGLQAFRDEARAATQRGRTIIYSTQILEVVERFADRVVVLESGKVRAADTLAALLAADGPAGTKLASLLANLSDESGAA